MKNVKETTKNHFNKTAETYNTSNDGLFVKCMYDEIIERIIKLHPQKILDLGCGNGNILKLISKKADLQLYGLDLSDKMVKEAEKKLGNKATFTIGDSENLPYEDNIFDVIVCNASFHHYPNPLKVLKEIKRTLKKDGTLILGDPTIPFNFILKIFNFFLRYSKSGDFKIYSQKEITKLLNTAGFDVTNFKKNKLQIFCT